MQFWKGAVQPDSKVGMIINFRPAPRGLVRRAPYRRPIVTIFPDQCDHGSGDSPSWDVSSDNHGRPVPLRKETKKKK
jgi:hypothetical protein